MRSKKKKLLHPTNSKARQKSKLALEKTKTRKEKPWATKTKTKTNTIPKKSTKTKKKTTKTPTIHLVHWRDAHGRFSTAVKYDGSHYRDKSGRIRDFATRAKRPSQVVAKPTKKAPKPRVVSAKAKPPRKPKKPARAQPKKPQKPVKAKPKKPTKPEKKPGKKPVKKPTKPKKKPVKKPKKKPGKKRTPPPPPPPPKTPLPQIFGKDRDEILVPIEEEIQERIEEAEIIIDQARRRGKGPSDISEIGYEYYILIAAIEKMSPHDIYTLFMSP